MNADSPRVTCSSEACDDGGQVTTRSALSRQALDARRGGGIRFFATLGRLKKAALLAMLCLTQLIIASPARSAATYPECGSFDDPALRKNLAEMISTELIPKLSSLKVEAVVRTHWEQLGISRTIDILSDRAVASVRNERGFLERQYSNYSEDKAHEFARDVVNRVFSAPEFQSAIQSLIDRVIQSLANEINGITQNATESAFECLSSFVKANYLKVIQGGLERQVRTKVTVAKDQINVGARFPTARYNFTMTATGVALVAGQRLIGVIASRVAQQVGGRIAAVVASKIPKLGGWIGVGILAWQIMAGSDGALPDILQELQSPPVKAEFQEGVTRSVRDALDSNRQPLAKNIADAVLGEWTQFRGRYRILIEQSERLLTFRDWLTKQDPEAFQTIAKAVDIVLKENKEAGLTDAVSSGVLDRLVTLPADGLTIAEQTGSARIALAWADLLPDRLSDIYRFEIHRVASPDAVVRDTWVRLLSLEDKTIIRRLLSAPEDAREALLLLPNDEVKGFSLRFESQNLIALTPYLKTLAAEDRLFLVRELLLHPAAVSLYAKESVQRRIFGAADKRAYISFLDREISIFAPLQFVHELSEIVEGSIPFDLAWAKYDKWAYLFLIVLFGIVFIRWSIRRVLGIGRTKVVVQAAPAAPT